jgi:hypothetical protein
MPVATPIALPALVVDTGLISKDLSYEDVARP